MTGSKYFDVCRFRMQGEKRENFERIRDATNGTEAVYIVTESGVGYRIFTEEQFENDQISVWGVSEHTHVDSGYIRFKSLATAESKTIPLRILGRLALERITAWVEERVR